MKEKEHNIGGWVIAIIFMIIGTALWYNVPKLPFESVEHYCDRISTFIVVHDMKGRENCLKEQNKVSERHIKLVKYLKNMFSDGKQTITDSQGECMASKIEGRLTDDQIDQFIKGKAIGDQIGASNGLGVMKDIMNCL